MSGLYLQFSIQKEKKARV